VGPKRPLQSETIKVKNKILGGTVSVKKKCQGDPKVKVRPQGFSMTGSRRNAREKEQRISVTRGKRRNEISTPKKGKGGANVVQVTNLILAHS